MKQNEPGVCGTVYTFYSYKGGVGRSMALANVAVLLAKWGKNVLIVDWDLEAPGIERYFASPSYHLSNSRSTTPGLVDLIHAYVADKKIDWHNCLLKASPLDQAHAVSILTAGQDTPDYVSRVRSLKWESLFEKRQLGLYLERLREEWTKEFDFVLIDSRTGITDIGGICTIHLPDLLVMFFTTNKQSLEGVIDIMNRARKARMELPFDRSYLIGIPVPARDESRTEYQSAIEWRKIFAKELAELYRDWLPKEKTPEDALEVLRLPYIPFWSFGERLPVVEEGTTAPESLGAAYERLARLIFNRLQWEEVWVGSVEKPTETTPFVTPTQFWNVPHPRNPLFVGREKLLQQLHDTLASRKVVALSGLGGIGKTQTAVEYAYRYRDEYQAVLWAKADSRETLAASFVAIAELLDFPEKTAQNQTLVFAAVKRWLENSSNWLLILDDADDLAMVREILSTKGHVLLTTRVQTTGTIAERLEINTIEMEDGALFLLRRAKVLASDAPLYSASTDDRKKAEEIVKELGGLPLALDQAGAFIEETPSSLAEYLELYKREGAKLLAERGELVTDYVSVRHSFSLAFKQVTAVDRGAADLLRICAFLAPDAIPEEIFTKSAPELGEILSSVVTDPLAFAKTIREAGRFSLIERDPTSKLLRIHPLVQEVIRGEMDEAEHRQWAERTVRAVNKTFPDVEFSTWSLCDRLLPHVQICAKLIEKWQLKFPAVVRLLNQAGRYLYERARYNEAEPLLQQALTIGEQTLGSNHLEVATSLNNLALLYHEQGQYARAEPPYQRALEIQEKAQGPDHLDVARGLNKLGLLYHDQGKYTEAEPLYRRALAILEKIQGSDPDVASSLNNLAELYRDLSKYAEAEPLYQQALVIREKTLGVEHPDVAQSLNNLGLLYHNQRKDSEAEDLLKRALAIRQKALGPDHPSAATSLHNLAVLYYDQKKYTDAEWRLRQALMIREKTLGSNHPKVAQSLEDLVTLLRQTDREAEAEKMEARARAICEKHMQENRKE